MIDLNQLACDKKINFLKLWSSVFTQVLGTIAKGTVLTCSCTTDLVNICKIRFNALILLSCLWYILVVGVVSSPNLVF